MTEPEQIDDDALYRANLVKLSERMKPARIAGERCERQLDLISAMSRTLEDCRIRLVGYDFDTAALQARIGECLSRAEKFK